MLERLTKQKLVVIGNGMAGIRTVETLLERAPDLYDITVFGAEPYGNYNRILLSPVLAGEKTVDDIMLNTEQWYRDNGITLRKGETVTMIDRRTCEVVTSDGSRLPMLRNWPLSRAITLPAPVTAVPVRKARRGSAWTAPVCAAGSAAARSSDRSTTAPTAPVISAGTTANCPAAGEPTAATAATTVSRAGPAHPTQPNRRARIPTTAPKASMVAVTAPISTGLSEVPRVATAHSLTGVGVRSMTRPPTARAGEASGAINPATR